MSRTVTIPTTANPFEIKINNTKYSYPAGTTQTVPDEVAAVIDEINRLKPKEADVLSTIPENIPNGKNGNYMLSKDGDSYVWSPITNYYMHSVALNMSYAPVGSTSYALSGIYNFESSSKVVLNKSEWFEQLKYHRVLFNGTLTVTPNGGESSVKTVIAIRKNPDEAKLQVWCVGEANPIEIPRTNATVTVADQIGWIN